MKEEIKKIEEDQALHHETDNSSKVEVENV